MDSAKEKSKDILSSMFVSAAVVMIFTQVVGVVAVILDGIITSRFLGEDAYSAISLLKPFVSIVLMMAGFLNIGNHVLCSELVGKGQRDKANATFSTAILMAAAASAAIVALCMIVPDILLSICGVSLDSHPEYYDLMMEYLHGYMIGIPAFLTAQIAGPIIAMDNDKRLFSMSAVVLLIMDVAGDIVNGYVLHGGVFGMGIATSVSYYAQLLLILSHFLKSRSFFRFTLQGISRKTILDICRAGVPALMIRLATALRKLAVSRINLSVALSVAGVAAKGIQDDINSALFCMSLGLGVTLMSLTGINYSGKDYMAIRRLFKNAVRISFIISLSVSLAVALAAPLIVQIYTPEPDIMDLAVFGIWCMAAGIVLDTMTVLYENYLQGIQKQRLLNIIVVCERFLIPVMMALLLGARFGSRGVLASFAVGKLLLVIMIYIVICLHMRKIPQRLDEILLLPENFGGALEDNLYAHIDTVDEAVKESQRVENFCAEHGTDAHFASNMAVVLEEMAVNVIKNGKVKENGHYGVDYRLHKDGDSYILSFRDLCEFFDPVEWYKTNHDSLSGSEGLGIRIITSIASDIRYFNAFNSNNIIIKVQYADNEENDHNTKNSEKEKQ